MQTMNIHAAKTQLSKLVEQVERGEEVVIARAGKPVARLVAIAQSKPKRVLGILGGTTGMGDDFLTPDPEMQRLFEGE